MALNVAIHSEWMLLVLVVAGAIRLTSQESK